MARRIGEAQRPDHGLTLSLRRNRAHRHAHRSQRGGIAIAARHAAHHSTMRCDHLTGMGKQRELRQHWQRTCKLNLGKPT
jgi:hypothetical protein